SHVATTTTCTTSPSISQPATSPYIPQPAASQPSQPLNEHQNGPCTPQVSTTGSSINFPLDPALQTPSQSGTTQASRTSTMFDALSLPQLPYAFRNVHTGSGPITTSTTFNFNGSCLVTPPTPATPSEQREARTHEPTNSVPTSSSVLSSSTLHQREARMQEESTNSAPTSSALLSSQTVNQSVAREPITSAPTISALLSSQTVNQSVAREPTTSGPTTSALLSFDDDTDIFSSSAPSSPTPGSSSTRVRPTKNNSIYGHVSGAMKGKKKTEIVRPRPLPKPRSSEKDSTRRFHVLMPDLLTR
ncbi:hypothetical protein H0H93_014746, partial [Arthromyces matolae]